MDKFKRMPTTRIPGVSLEVEDRPRLQSPRLERVLAALHELTPDGGPSFLVLDRGRSYMQAAGGGDGQYVAEWREDHWPEFRHFAAGHAGAVPDGTIEVATASGHVTVRHSEVLSRDDVERIVLAFIHDKGRPTDFVWRDMTDIFV